jgi:rod shape determining protein RodA
MASLNRRYIADFDWTLLALALAVGLFGVIEISSAEPAPGHWQRQLAMLGVGTIILFLTTLIDYHKIVNAAPFLYGAGLILLALVLSPLGREVHGNKSWLQIGPLGGQPSEFAKIFTILLLTRFLDGVRKRPLDLRTVMTAGLLWFVPTVLVYAENDTGSTLSFISFLAAMLFLTGLRWSWVAAGVTVLALALAIGLPSLCNSQNKSYKAQRIMAVCCPEKAEKQYRYQNEQSEIAVGSGGIFGKGFHRGTQGPLGFVPEVHTDFIYAILSEEWGFLGSAFVLTCYLLMITRLFQIARQARDRTGLLLASGYAALLLYHVAVSIGMVLRLLPIMGIPLPLMSFGGSSVLATFFALGLALNVRLHRFVN